MDAIKFHIYNLSKKINPRKARIFFNNSYISKSKKKKILSKAGIILSPQASIAEPFYFEFGNIEIIGNVLINANCVFLDNEQITIKNNTMIGPNVTISTVSHHVQPKLRHMENISAPINIGENVWIGAGSVILPGVHIGDNSVIAANSVVTQSIPENSLFAGSPAKLKREI